MATWKPAPSTTAVASTGTGKGAGTFGHIFSPAPQNFPATGQPFWEGAPKNTALVNTTAGQTV